MKTKLTAFACLLGLALTAFFGCSRPDTTEDNYSDLKMENQVAMADSTAATNECNTGYYSDSSYNLTARIDEGQNGDYIVTTTLSKPNSGSIFLTKDTLHVFEDPKSTDKNKEIIRVRELVFTYSDTGNTLTQPHTIKAADINAVEVVTVTVDFPNPVIPKKPKVIIRTPGSTNTPPSDFNAGR